MSKFPEYKEFLNEEATNHKSYDFNNINGQLKLNLSYQESGSYDSTRTVAEPNAEIKLWMENKDSAIYYFYTGNNIEDDREKFLESLKKTIKEFDENLDKVLKDSGFTK
jgi:hypothetical protein